LALILNFFCFLRFSVLYIFPVQTEEICRVRKWVNRRFGLCLGRERDILRLRRCVNIKTLSFFFFSSALTTKTNPLSLSSLFQSSFLCLPMQFHQIELFLILSISHFYLCSDCSSIFFFPLFLSFFPIGIWNLKMKRKLRKWNFIEFFSLLGCLGFKVSFKSIQ